MHTKLKILLCRPRWAILLVLVLLIISSFCVTSTDTEPTSQTGVVTFTSTEPKLEPTPQKESNKATVTVTFTPVGGDI